jgi:hypothetical protein
MSLNKVCLTIAEDASGANGPGCTGRSARIESAADALVDWVYEELVDYGVNLDERGLAVIRQLVARAMITQHDYDQELLASALTTKFGGPPATVPS